MSNDLAAELKFRSDRQTILAMDESLESAKRKAKEESKKGYVQHVNENYKGVFTVEDWYDSDKTRASFENGRALDGAMDSGDVNSWAKSIVKHNSKSAVASIIKEQKDAAAECEKRSKQFKSIPGGNGAAATWKADAQWHRDAAAALEKLI